LVEKRFVTTGAIIGRLFVVSLETVRTVTASGAITTVQISNVFISDRLEREQAISFNDVRIKSSGTKEVPRFGNASEP
jgi:hypothetical protein